MKPAMATLRVAFYAHFCFHEPILRPIHDEVAARARTLLTLDRRKVVAFRPDVLVVTAHAHIEYFRYHLPQAILVDVRHGMVSKRKVHRLPGWLRERPFAYVCVGDSTVIETYDRAGVRPLGFWETGYPQLDPLFRRVPPPPLPLDPTAPTVLYAPTWNLGLTSAPMLGTRLVELIRRGAPAANIIIKPHPMIGDWRPRWMRWWRSLAARFPGVLLVSDTHVDVTRYMLAADVLISDASSAIFEFLVLDRPIIVVTNPRRRADPNYDPDDILWRWRDVGEEVTAVDELPAAVERALKDPGRASERRARYRAALFGRFNDGYTYRRIADRILDTGAQPRPTPESAAVGRPSLAICMWSQLREAIWASRWLRRSLLGPRESLRLWARQRSRRSAP